MSYLYQMDMENTVSPPISGSLNPKLHSFCQSERVASRGGPNERWGVLKNRAMHSARANSGARELTPENALYHAHTPRPRTERPPMADAYGHTTGNTPEPVRFQKLSLVRPS